MSSEIKSGNSTGSEGSLVSEEQQNKVNEVRKLIGPVYGKLALYCTDACIMRYLRARNWHVKKAAKMLKTTLKWRLEYKPEMIRWEDIAKEAETGKIYRANYSDKLNRTVLVMRPSAQNTKVVKGQIKYLVYCMENAILNLPENQEQMVWMIDFGGFNMSHISLKATKETAQVLQEHYPERLGIAILYNPPKIFEPFWKVAKPFLEPKTANKVNFVYSDNPNSKKIMEELFDMDQLEPAFGGKFGESFDVTKYAERMKEDDKKVPAFWKTGEAPAAAVVPPGVPLVDSSSTLELDSDASDHEKEKEKEKEDWKLGEEDELKELSIDDEDDLKSSSDELKVTSDDPKELPLPKSSTDEVKAEK